MMRWFLLDFDDKLNTYQCLYLVYKLKCNCRLCLFNFHNMNTQIWTSKVNICQTKKKDHKWINLFI